MSNWKRRGSVGICFWSLLLALLGISQLIFGAYYVSKLPVFKIGSPVWVGFLVSNSNSLECSGCVCVNVLLI